MVSNHFQAKCSFIRDQSATACFLSAFALSALSASALVPLYHPVRAAVSSTGFDVITCIGNVVDEKKKRKTLFVFTDRFVSKIAITKS